MSATDKAPHPPASPTPTPEPAAETAAAPAAPAVEDFSALVRAQEGLSSAESFWKAAGRFSKLR